MKIGVVYYSRTGNTRYAAKLLGEKLRENNIDVDLLEIEAVKKPGFFKVGWAAMRQLDLPIKNTDYDLKEYDVIVAGVPVWISRPAPFIKTFMNRAKNVKGKKGAVFVTGANNPSKQSKAIKIVRSVLEKNGVKPLDDSLALKMKKEKIKDGKQNIDDFIEVLLPK